MKIVPPDAEGIARAAALLRTGGVVAYPTETVYGLAVDPLSPEAVDRLFEVKGREERNPVLLIVDNASQLEAVTASIPDAARPYMDRFWPGPLSMLFPRDPALPEQLTAGGAKVCVRCPANETARALCRAFGGALTSTSANRSGEPPATSVDGLNLPGVDLAIDAGPLPPSAPSTIFDPETGTVLREGAIGTATLKRPG